MIENSAHGERIYLERLYEDTDETFNKIFSGDQ